jgi:site-specific DNA recombinase
VGALPGLRYCLQYRKLQMMNTTTKNPRRAPRTAVGVVRISTNRDNETSTTTQSERITAWCQAQGIELIEIFSDVGRSAYKESRANRPGLSKAMDHIHAGVDVLVCWKIDRVARNTRDLLELIHEVETQGSSFASVTEQFDTATPIGKLVVTVIGALAEMESAIKSERIGAWQDHRRTTGATPTGPTPYGYRRERNRLIKNEAEAAVILEAAEAVLARESLRKITARLNQAGARPEQPFTRRGLAAILTGPTTAGLREVEGEYLSSDAWEPILDRPTWEEVRAILTDPARRTGPGPDRRWLLSGLLECGGRDDCGASMYARPHPYGPRYTCPSCHLSIAAADTDDLVTRQVLDGLNPEAWRRLRNRGSRAVDTEAMERELAELARQRRDKEIIPAEWEILRVGIIRDLEDAAAGPVRLPDVADPRAEWPDLALDARRLIVAAVISKIVVQPARRGLNAFDDRRIVTTPVS